jgi:hypothetical protein
MLLIFSLVSKERKGNNGEQWSLLCPLSAFSLVTEERKEGLGPLSSLSLPLFFIERRKGKTREEKGKEGNNQTVLV